MRGAWSGAVALALVACASASGNGGASTAHLGNVITTEEIEKIQVNTAAEIVERLRPSWLRGRGVASIGGGTDLPVVYIDDVRQGGPEQLERIAARIVREIRFLSGIDASVKYGLGHGGGAIVVLTRTPGDQAATSPATRR